MIKLFFLFFFMLLIAVPIIQDAHTASTVKLIIDTVPRNLFHIDGGGTFNFNDIAMNVTAPEEFEGYRFVEWKVDGINRDGNPINILMDKGRTATAHYSDKIAEITIDTVPRVAKITADNTVYLPSELPEEFEWDISSIQTINAEQIVTNGMTRYIFSEWNDLEKSALRQITVIEDFELKALYDTQHLLTMSSLYGETTGSGWYNEGSEATFTILDNFVEENNGLRHSFIGWYDGLTNYTGNSLIITEPTNLEALWDDQYLLRVESSIPELDIDSKGWYEKDSYAYVFAPNEFFSQSENTLYKFAGWSVSANAEVLGDTQSTSFSIKMDSPHSAWSNWEKQYALDVDDPYGIADLEDYYPEGTFVQLNVNTEEIIIKPNEIRVVFDGFEGDGDYESNTKILMDEPKSLQVKGTKQYYLNIESQYGGTTGSGWYDEGEIAQFRITNLKSPAGFWQQHLFDGWSGDFSGNVQAGNFVMDSPKKLTAKWKQDSSIGVFNSLILIGALVGGGLFYFKMRKKITSFGQSIIKKDDHPEDDESTSENKTKPDPDYNQIEITAKKFQEIQLEARITNLRSEKQIAKSTISSLRLEQEQLQAKISSLKSEKETTISNISSLKLEQDQIQEKITNLKSEKESARRELEKYQEKTSDVESKLAQVKNDLESKQERLNSLIAEATNKKNEISKIENEIEVAKLNPSNSEKEQPQQVIDAASAIISQMNQKCKDLEKELKMTKSILEIKKSEYEDVSSELDRSKTEFDSLDSEEKKVEKSI